MGEIFAERRRKEQEASDGGGGRGSIARRRELPRFFFRPPVSSVGRSGPGRSPPESSNHNHNASSGSSGGNKDGKRTVRTKSDGDDRDLCCLVRDTIGRMWWLVLVRSCSDSLCLVDPAQTSLEQYCEHSRGCCCGSFALERKARASRCYFCLLTTRVQLPGGEFHSPLLFICLCFDDEHREHDFTKKRFNFVSSWRRWLVVQGTERVSAYSSAG